MAVRYKVLGQASPAANTPNNIYTVTGSKDAVVSSIIVANRDANSATYRIAVRPDGATLADIHYIAYDVQVGSNLSVALNLGLTLNTDDVITVQSSSGLVTFNVYGTEIDA